MRKKNLVTAVLVASMLVGSLGVTSTPAEAKSKIKLSCKSMSLNGGASKTIKIKGTNKKKVKWSVVSGKKVVKLKNKKKTSVKIVALKRGTAKVQAKLGKKKYICRVTVRKSTPAKTITITTADTQTAKTLHDALNKGKALNIKVKGSKTSASKLMKSVSKLVGEYNKYDVVPQYEDYSEESADSGYRTFTLSSTEVNTYKYGLLLVKDIITELKKDEDEMDVKHIQDTKNTENNVRKEYEVGSESYKNIFKEVTGVSYEDYQKATTAKSKTLNCYEEYCWKMKDNPSETYDLPNDFYYVSYKDETGQTKYWYEDVVMLYMQYKNPAEKGDYNNYSVISTDYYARTVDARFSDVTFHYEPLTVDLAAVNQAVENKIREEVISIVGQDAYTPYAKSKVQSQDFNTLSQAVQQKYISFAFRYNTKWCGYTLDDSKHSGDGLIGIKSMLNHSWWGKCGDYARMEITMYKLFGIEDKDIRFITCKPCNHGFSAVRVTNSKGQKAWLRNDYGIGTQGATGVPKHYHDRTYPFKVIDDFVC